MVSLTCGSRSSGRRWTDQFAESVILFHKRNTCIRVHPYVSHIENILTTDTLPTGSKNTRRIIQQVPFFPAHRRAGCGGVSSNQATTTKQCKDLTKRSFHGNHTPLQILGKRIFHLVFHHRSDSRQVRDNRSTSITLKLVAWDSK